MRTSTVILGILAAFLAAGAVYSSAGYAMSASFAAASDRNLHHYSRAATGWLTIAGACTILSILCAAFAFRSYRRTVGR